MPLGSEHEETGLLLHERGSLILQRDAGGRWRLDIGRNVEKLLGRRVRLRGTRCGFDCLAVDWIRLAD
jgi:hypothetical protein